MAMTYRTLKSSFFLAICYPACIMTVDTATTRYIPIGSEIKQLDWHFLYGGAARTKPDAVSYSARLSGGSCGEGRF